ncbi:MAG: M14 family metallopeptidase [Gammaproteobacteria bacterium]|nr:M14 family metallopeptidase [Gammaproteobacteria bacterium]
MKNNINLSCFPASYTSARQHLLQTLQQISGQLTRRHQTFSHPLTGPNGQALHLDWLWLGQNEAPENILVLISGTHGVEGFTGSAIQSHWLPYLAEQLAKHPELGVIIIHALNPWGFAWLRRYDHEGIDLNRNFIDFNATLPQNKNYDLIHKDLFCDTSRQVADTLAYWKSKLGHEDFHAVITRGQYQHPDGLFYGGASPSWSRQVLEQACRTTALQNARRIAAIDLHTGLGPYGHGEVINDHQPGSAGFNLACQWYGANAQSALLGESCSPPKSGLVDYFWHDLIGGRGCFVTLEYGTYSLEKLLTVSCEEQRYHNSYGQNLEQRTINHAAVTAIHDFFYPKDHVWRELVLFRAGQVITMALQGILK